MEDSLRTAKQLDFYGVKVFFVSQGIDSGDKSSRAMLTMHGMMDEQFIQGLADKVHRGQEGQVLKGLQAGGRCYGYRNKPMKIRHGWASTGDRQYSGSNWRSSNRKRR